MRLIVAVFVFVFVIKVVLRFVVGGILKERFVWNVDFVEGGVVNFKEQGFKDF